jgi:CMP-N-acetylneuraminic acid synthetase
VILGLIPARGGSKRLPRKNLSLLAGRPLLQWTLDAARQSQRLERIIVSTEDAEIRDFCERQCVEVLRRPPELATDGATTAAVLQHAVEVLSPTVVVLLQPTSPIRFRGLIDRCIDTFNAADCDTLATGFISYQFPYGSIGNVPQQEMQGFFYDDGNVYVHKAAHLREGKWFGERRHEMIVEPWYNMEIDTLADLWAAEGIIHRMHQ